MLFAVGGAGLGALALVACGSGDGGTADSASTASTAGAGSTTGTASTASTVPATSTASAASTSSTGGDATAACVDEIPDETGGPYPGDGSNGVNVLSEDGVVRRDITSSFGSSTTVADGIPLEVTLTIQDATTCTPMPGAAVYLWHCTRPASTRCTPTASPTRTSCAACRRPTRNGQVQFTTIVPGCYDGRWPHMHFEVFDALSCGAAGQRTASRPRSSRSPRRCREVAYQRQPLPAEHPEPRPALAGVRHRLQRRRRCRTNWPRSRGEQRCGLRRHARRRADS